MTIAARNASTLLSYRVYCNGFCSSSSKDLIGVPGGGQNSVRFTCYLWYISSLMLLKILLERKILLDLRRRFGDGGIPTSIVYLASWCVRDTAR
jgi:hypothetical protein